VASCNVFLPDKDKLTCTTKKTPFFTEVGQKWESIPRTYRSYYSANSFCLIDVAVVKGTDVRPTRNLAKSVTVE